MIGYYQNYDFWMIKVSSFLESCFQLEETWHLPKEFTGHITMKELRATSITNLHRLESNPLPMMAEMDPK
jgi:hypothetical protein